jgi:hypothetical protein
MILGKRKSGLLGHVYGVEMRRHVYLFILAAGLGLGNLQTSQAGVISTVVGNGVSGYNGDGIDATTARLCFPMDVALDSSGDLYIADSANFRIRKVTYSSADAGPVAPSVAISNKLEKGQLLAAPNILDLSRDGSLSIYMRGNPNAAVEVGIYDESGDLIGNLAVNLDSSGFGEAAIVNGTVDGRRLGPGMYWALASGGGVNAKKRFLVVPRRR